MSYPYQYPPPGRPGAPHPTQQPPPNGYAPNGYPMQQQASQMPMGYVNPQQIQNQPMVVVPQRSSQQYAHQTPNRPPHQYLSQPHASTMDSIKVEPPTHSHASQMDAIKVEPRNHPMAQQTPRPQQTHRRPQEYTTRVRQQQQTPSSYPGGIEQQYQRTPQQRGQYQQQVSQFQQQMPRPPQHTPRPQQQTPRPQQQTPQYQTTWPQQHAPQSQAPRPQQQASRPAQARKSQVVIHTPARAPSATSTPRPSLSPSGGQPDYNILLLLLAEEYVGAAYTIGPVVALANRPADRETYYSLMATGMGCMEAALNQYHLHPALEGQLRLRFATLLHDETNNNVEAEAVLNKGIMLCQRHRFLDLKYSMQHLQARNLAKTNPKAAIKSLDNVIKEAEDYKHVPWVYALRFLCVTLSQQKPSHHETSTALHHLEAISALSADNRDMAVYVACAVFKAFLHLRTPGPESMTEARRAIADARQYQLDPSIQKAAQINTLLTILDLVCCVQSHNRAEVLEKSVAMQSLMDSQSLLAPSNDEGYLGVPIDHSSSGQLHTSTGGIFRKTADGRDQLVFSWIHRRDLYCLGYYLSGVAHSMHNERKSRYFLQEGIKLTRGIYLPDSCQHLPITDHILESLQQYEPHPESISGPGALNAWRILIDWHARLQQAFIHCCQADWSAARTALSSLEQTASDSTLGDVTHRMRLVIFLSGTIDQGEGQIDSALASYQSPDLALPKTCLVNDSHTDIAIVAALNSLLIIREASHPQHFLFEIIVAQLEPLCNAHESKDITTAFTLIRGLAVGEGNVNRTQWIRRALNMAKAISNQQLMAISMNAFTNAFASDSLDGQALKAHHAAMRTAERARSALWECTADGMLATLLEKQGKNVEAAEVRGRIEELRPRLPEDLRGD